MLPRFKASVGANAWRSPRLRGATLDRITRMVALAGVAVAAVSTTGALAALPVQTAVNAEPPVAAVSRAINLETRIAYHRGVPHQHFSHRSHSSHRSHYSSR